MQNKIHERISNPHQDDEIIENETQVRLHTKFTDYMESGICINIRETG